MVDDKEIQQREKELSDIKLVLKDFLKVIKVVSMYPADNPLPQSLRQSFAEKLESIAGQYGPIDITVEKEYLTYKDEEVYRDRSKEDSLAGLFFNTGITRFSLNETLSVEEIFKLLDVFKEFLNAPKNSCDLAGMLWESGISDFRFSTVEDIALSGYDGKIESDMLGGGGSGSGGGQSLFGTDDSLGYSAMFDHSKSLGPTEVVGSSKSGGKGAEDSGEIPEGASVFFSHAYRNLDEDGEAQALESEGELNTVAAARAMGLTDVAPTKSVPNTTLILNDEFKLSEEEEKTFKQMLEEDILFDPYESTVEILKEILHQETDYAGFNESVTICEKVQSDLLKMGGLLHAAELLGFIRDLEDRVRTSMPQWADRLKEAAITAGSRDRLQFFAEALNEQPQLDPSGIGDYLEKLGWESLAGVTDLLGDIAHREHREAICNYLSSEGKNKVDLISRGIFDKRWFVVRNSASILARIADNKALNYLTKVLTHEDKRVRLAIVENLKDCTNIKALEVLAKLVMDPDAEVREKAVRSIISYKGSESYELIENIIQNIEFVTFEQRDKNLLLEAYSILGGDRAVSYLTALIMRFNPFRKAGIKELRQGALDALVHNKSEKAEKILLSLTGNWRWNIRNLAKLALHKRRALIYGAEENATDD